ncbi:metal-dependent hydrolase [Pseudoalteromonas luteoviolacea]|nr:metal-dependent hydrolase [Pseudoalteromonas luteoviolacea]
MQELKYFQHYPENLQDQVRQLITNNQLQTYFRRKYPAGHQLQSQQGLYQYSTEIKQRFLKNAPRLNSVSFNKHTDMVKGTLGTHTHQQRVHGKKLKARYDIALNNQLKYAPEAILRALIVHELAHFKHAEHNKAFYNLCCHMEPDYHQLELDLRLFIVLDEQALNFYKIQ